MESLFTLERSTLLNILSSMQPICTKRTMLDITSSLLFHVGHRELSIKSTDLEISLQASCFLKRETPTAHNSTFLVPGKRLFDLVKELDEGDVTFSLSQNVLSLNAQGVHLSLNTKSAEHFPPFPERIENILAVDSSFFLALLNKVAFLIPQNNANHTLNGLFLEIDRNEIRMTSTDGHCLSQVRSTQYILDEPRSWLVPRRAIFEIRKLLENEESETIFLGTCANQLVFSGDSFNFFTKVLSGQFPRYQEIVATEGFIPATVDRSHLVKALRRSSCLLSGQFIATAFDFSKDLLRIAMRNDDVGQLQEEIPLKQCETDPMTVRFYAPYLLNGLQILTDDQISFYLKSPAKPIVFKSHDERMHMLYLVMPVAPTHG